jgi:ubiquitin carboxyl-terminal hydrolase 9/13
MVSDCGFSRRKILIVPSSYCNSILQCLYYSVPFRESVLNYPKRSPLEALHAAQSLPRISTATSPLVNGSNNPASPAKPKPLTSSASARNPGAPVTQQQKPEDKDSPEYKKKQAMLAGPILSMGYDNSASYGMSENLFTSLKDIFEAVVASHSRMGVISPAKFLEVLRKENEMFRTSMHQDAHEFLNLLLNSVVTNVEENAKRRETDSEKESQPSEKDIPMTNHVATPASPMTPIPNGTRSPNTTRWVHELFEGTLTSETKCLTCENISQRDEAFLDLSVDLEQHASVTSCLRKFSEEEMLCERNKFHCDNCGGLQEAEKRMKIKRLPKILALHLKRFKYTEDLQRLQKLFHRVVYPYYIRLFNTTDDAEDPDRLYELYAVVVHIGGGPYHGHYIAIIKTEDRGWLLFDDEMVEPVDKSYVRNFFGDRPGLACAYVLFYQETTFEAMQREQESDGHPLSEDVKQAVGLGLKTNGVASAELHRVSSITTSPILEDTERFANLDHAVTAPQLSPPTKTPLTPMTPLQPIASAGISEPVLSPKKSDVQSKKELAKAEKEREKERKAAEKARLKEEEEAKRNKIKENAAKFRDAQKKQEADLKAAIEASKASKAEEDRRSGPEPSHKENGVPTGGFGSLNRFKPGGKSLRKAKLPWGSKDKDEPDVPGAATDSDHAVTSPPAPANNTPEKPDKSKNRFSLRKKSLSMLS